ALRRRPAQYLDLAVVETKALIYACDLRFGRSVIWQENPRRAAFDDRRRNMRALDIGETLGGKDHARIFLAQGLQPCAKLRCESRAIEDEPALVDDDESRRAVETPLDPVEKIGKH